MPKKVKVPLGKSGINLYTGSKIAEAVAGFLNEASLYDGVKRLQLLEAIYNQGRKDGAASAFTAAWAGMKQAERAVPHRNPGRPRLRK